tara:strand:- start:924 stop:1481 length:558 start_codon:yes stop_codon:yes gene_type:complete
MWSENKPSVYIQGINKAQLLYNMPMIISEEREQFLASKHATMLSKQGRSARRKRNKILKKIKNIQNARARGRREKEKRAKKGWKLERVNKREDKYSLLYGSMNEPDVNLRRYVLKISFKIKWRSAIKIQALFRGYRERKYFEFKDNPNIVLGDINGAYTWKELAAQEHADMLKFSMVNFLYRTEN